MSLRVPLLDIEDDLVHLIDRKDRHCIGVPLSTFIPPEGEDGKELSGWPLIRHQAKAKEFCRECPAKQECLEYATKYRMIGVWGGTNERERGYVL